MRGETAVEVALNVTKSSGTHAIATKSKAAVRHSLGVTLVPRYWGRPPLNLADPQRLTYPPRVDLSASHSPPPLFLTLPPQQQRSTFLRPSLVTRSPAAMYSKTLPSGLIALMFAMSAFSRLVPDLPPGTQMVEVPKRIVAAQTPTTEDLPYSTMEQDGGKLGKG